MSSEMIMPKPGNYFRIGETIYRAMDDGGEIGCSRCVFVAGELGDRHCTANDQIYCKGLYFEDHTHELKEVELVDEPATKNPLLSVAIGLVIMIVAIVYKLIM